MVGLVGLAMVLACFVRFVREGRGTPAPIAPTEELVVDGLYRYLRNPMYVGVDLAIAGQCLAFRSLSLVVWLALFTVAVTVFVSPTSSRRWRAVEAAIPVMGYPPPEPSTGDVGQRRNRAKKKERVCRPTYGNPSENDRRSGQATQDAQATSGRLAPVSEPPEPMPPAVALFAQSANGRVVTHFTYFEETGALHFHEVIHAKVVAVPLDGTGPSYTGNFRTSDSENIRAVGHGDLLVEPDTDLNRAVARGSDGSRAFVKEHAHFTVNANGETSVEFSTSRMVCT